MERHGVANVFQSKTIREKHRQTMLNKHGCENPSQIGYVK